MRARNGPVTRRGRLLAVTAVAAAVAAAGVAVAAGLNRQSPQEELREQLAARVTAVLERSSPDEHHDHGHHFGEDAGTVVCAVDPFGFSPESARTMAEVKWVYARHMCAVTGAGESWAMSVRASGPLAVRLDEPPEVHVPEPGAGYPERVKQIIPQRFHERALAEFGDEEALESARERFERARG